MPLSSRNPKTEYLAIAALVLSLLDSSSLLSKMMVNASTIQVRTDGVGALSYHLVVSALAATMRLGELGVFIAMFSFFAWFQILFMPAADVDNTPRVVLQARGALVLSVTTLIAVISALICLYVVTHGA